jgi:hypothetical protein
VVSMVLVLGKLASEYQAKGGKQRGDWKKGAGHSADVLV